MYRRWCKFLQRRSLPAFLAVLLCTQIVAAAQTPGVANPADDQLFKVAKTKLDRGDYHGAYQLLLPLGRVGYAKAQDVLASFYIQGLGVKADRVKAMQWYCALAHQPQGGRMVMRAVWLLAEYFRTGGGLPDKLYKNKHRENEDPYRAYFWFQVLAHQKDYYQQVHKDGEKLGNIGRFVMARQLDEAEIDQLEHYLKQWEPHEPLPSLEDCLRLPQGG